jgi:hypothetical protein
MPPDRKQDQLLIGQGPLSSRCEDLLRAASDADSECVWVWTRHIQANMQSCMEILAATFSVWHATIGPVTKGFYVLDIRLQQLLSARMQSAISICVQ